MKNEFVTIPKSKLQKIIADFRKVAEKLEFLARGDEANEDSRIYV